MASSKRIKTKYPGVYYREAKRIGGPGVEKVYYVVFKVNGKTKEEAVGRQYKDAMTPSRASNIRGQLVEGKRKTRQQKKKAKALKKWTIDALWQEYTIHKNKNASFQSDVGRYVRYIEKYIGEKKPAGIVSLDIERIKLRMKKSGKSPQTIKHVLALIKRLINFGTNHGLCSGINFKIIVPVVNNCTTEDLIPDELCRLLEAIEQDSNKVAGAIMKMALFTGMRRTELFKLQWNDINFHRGFILIREPKGGKSQEIPLNNESRKLLEEWPRTSGSPFVFPGKDGKQRVTISSPVQRIKKRAGLPESFRPLHGLRHVYASMLASSGKVDMYTLQKLLTHKSPQMTQRYAILRDDALKRAADLAGGIIADAMQDAGNVVDLKDHQSKK